LSDEKQSTRFIPVDTLNAQVMADFASERLKKLGYNAPSRHDGHVGLALVKISVILADLAERVERLERKP